MESSPYPSNASLLSPVESWRVHLLKLLFSDTYSIWSTKDGTYIFVWRKLPLYDTSRWYVDIIRHLNEHHAVFSYGYDGTELEVRIDRLSFLSLLAGRILEWRKATNPKTYYYVTQKQTP